MAKANGSAGANAARTTKNRGVVVNVVPAPWEDPAEFVRTHGRPTIKINAHPTGGYRKTVGGRAFQLGHDTAIAARYAYEITRVFRAAKSMGLGTDHGANHWLSPTDEWDVFTDRSVKNWAPHDPNVPTRGKLVWRTLESLKLFRRALEGDEVAQRELLVWPEDQQRAAAESYRERTVQKATKRLRSDPGLLKQMEHMVILSGLQTLSEAADAYYKVVDASARAGVSKPKLKHRIKRCVEEIGDMSLTQLTHDELTAAVDGWVSKAKAGKISPVTMTNQVRALRGFVDWLDASNRTSWTAPRRWERIFRLGNRSDVAKLKRERPVEPKSFSVEELQKLYHAADKTMRLWILLGLQVGMTQRDVAKLCPEQIDLEKRTLWYRRSKTGCYARVPLAAPPRSSSASSPRASVTTLNPSPICATS